MRNITLSFTMSIYVMILFLSSIYFSLSLVFDKQLINVLALGTNYLLFTMVFFQYTKLEYTLEQ